MNVTELFRYMKQQKEIVKRERPKPFGFPISEQVGFDKGWDACMEIVVFYIQNVSKEFKNTKDKEARDVFTGEKASEEEPKYAEYIIP